MAAALSAWALRFLQANVDTALVAAGLPKSTTYKFVEEGYAHSPDAQCPASHPNKCLRALDFSSLHFDKLWRDGGVNQIWIISYPADGSDLVQHNQADGTWTVYEYQGHEPIDRGTWTLKDGAYYEKSSMYGSETFGNLVGNKHSFHIDAEVRGAGYINYD